MRIISRLALSALAIALSVGTSAWGNEAPAAPSAQTVDAIRAAYAAGDYKEVLRLWTPWAQAGNRIAQYNLGQMYSFGRGVASDQAAGVAWYRKAAEQGLMEAQYDLGVDYATGTGVAEDQKAAADWYRKAADQGMAQAQYNLGNMYLSGLAVPLDASQAASWYRKAADQGLLQAEFDLGMLYLRGTGVPQDDVSGVAWTRKAADQGFARAQCVLGLLSAKGQGVPIDMVTAYMWITLGLADSKALDDPAFVGAITQLRAYVVAKMTPAERQEAEARARAWKPVTAH